MESLRCRSVVEITARVLLWLIFDPSELVLEKDGRSSFQKKQSFCATEIYRKPRI
jgi:hypothetical protein